MVSNQVADGPVLIRGGGLPLVIADLPDAGVELRDRGADHRRDIYAPSPALSLCCLP
jgi:hypothetical protein